jgi:hypothetical protein
VSDRTGLAWRSLDVSAEALSEEAPASLVSRRLCAGAGVVDIRGLATSDLMRETVVFVGGVRPDSWTPWAQFLERYEQLSRNVTSESARFCVVLQGGEPLVPDTCRAGVSTRGYRAILSALDLRLFLRRLGRTSTDSSLLSRLREELLVELAGFDPALAVDLAAEPTERLLAPGSALAAYSAKRVWREDAPPPLEWATGGADEVDGVRRVHLALALLHGRTKDVEQTVWRAQVRFLFPLIEEERVRLLDSHGHHLRFPITTRDGVITEKLEVEIGILARELDRYPVDGRTRRHLGSLRDARNSLAHLRAVNAADLRRLENGLQVERR